jgi:hypothetical protein
MKILLLFLLLVSSTALAEKTQYLSERRHVNVRLYPLSLFIGRLSGDVDIKVASQWTIGPTVSYGNMGLFGSSLEYSSFGVRVNYYLNGAAISDGWYVGGALEQINAKAESEGLKAESSGSAVTALGGYTVMYDSFNMNFGGGLVASNAESVSKTEDLPGSHKEVKVSAKPSGLYLEFTVGWAF